MKITIKKDHVLLKNSSGEYHLSLEKFKTLGKEKAVKFAETEINKKKNSTYTKKTIAFKDARELGFCAYGIKDFCKKLNLDITKEYSLDFLADNLTVNIINNYPNECLKLFGKNTFKAFGGVLGYLDQEDSKVGVVLKSGAFSDSSLYLIACDFALSSLHLFEERYPDDKRPRLAIEARLDWLEGKITDGELENAAQAAQDAACGYSSATYTAFFSAAYYAATAAAAASASASAAASSYTYASYSSYVSGICGYKKAQKEYIKFIICLEALKQGN